MNTNITLPNEELGVVPYQILELSNIENKMYIYGTNKLLSIDLTTNEISNSIEISKCGTFFSSDAIAITPNFRFIDYNENDKTVYCVTPDFKLYFINALNDNIEVEIEEIDYHSYLSSSVVYNSELNRVYWLINTWVNGSVIKVYNGTTGEYLNESISFDYEIFDMLTFDDKIAIGVDFGVMYLTGIGLNIDNTILTAYEGLRLHDIENHLLVCSYSSTSGINILHIINKIDGSIFKEIELEENHRKYYDITYNSLHEKCLISTGKNNISYDKIYIIKHENSDYFIDEILEFDFNFLFSLETEHNSNYAYIGGNDYLGKILLSDNSITLDNTIYGCKSTNLEIVYSNDLELVYSANSFSGTVSKHSNECLAEDIKQTAISARKGCFNHINNKMYFINDHSNYRYSPVVIIDGENNEIIETIELGTYLTDIVYSEEGNNIFITSSNDKKIFVIDGETNNILDIQFVSYPTLLFSYKDRVYCTVFDLGVYSIDPVSFDMTPIYYNTSWPVSGFAADENNDRVFVLHYSNGVYTPHLAVIDHNTSAVQLIEIPTASYDICYNPSISQLYILSLVDPKIHIYDEELNYIQNVDISDEPYLSNAQLELDPFKDKLYIMIDKEDVRVLTMDCSDYNIDEQLTHANVSGLKFNEINDQIYYYDVSYNQNNKMELVYRAIDGENMGISYPVYSENIINENYYYYHPFAEFLPVFNNIGNKIYFGNGDFSNISVVNCNIDKLQWPNSKWKWISFPRLERYENEFAPTVQLLERLNCFPCYIYLKAENGLYKEYKLGTFGWEWQGYLDGVQSSQGYKLNIESYMETIELPLYGSKINPETEITLYPDQDNWTGYYIDYPQKPWDCFDEDDWEKLTMIKTQYWTMIRGSTDPPYWYIKGKVTPFEYGDLVILRTDDVHTMSWIASGEEAESEKIPKTEYFTFEEQADYLPVFVEFDETSDVMEFAVKVEGEIRGAAVRSPGDSIVHVNAYLEGTSPGAPIEFETWDGYKSAPAGKTDYIVYNPRTKKKEKRIIYTGESVLYQLVSLKHEEVYEIPDAISEVGCLPNPFNEKTNISFRLNEATQVWVEIFDMNGRKINTLLQGELPGGYYNTVWYGDNESHGKVEKGIYFYKIRTNDGTVFSDKIVLIK